MKRSRTAHSDGWLYGIVSQVLWGTGGPAIKLVDTVLPGSLLVALRHGVGAFILGTQIFTRKRHVLRGVPWIHLVIIGVFAGGLPDLFLVEAVRRAGPIIAVMLARLEIPLGVIFAHWLLKEKVGLSAYGASLLAFLGVGIISFRPDEQVADSDQFLSGVLFGILAALTWALSGVYCKYILNRKTDPLALSFTRLAVGAIFSLAVALVLVRHPFEILHSLKLTDWGLIIYLGIFLSGLAYLAFYKSLNVLDAHVVAILLSVSIAVTLFAGLLVGDQVKPLQWLGISCIIVSLLILRRKPQKAEKPLDAD